jgi:hypothetical protein
MGVGVDVAVLMGMLMFVFMPVGFIVVVAAVHLLLPVSRDCTQSTLFSGKSEWKGYRTVGQSK